MSKTCSYRSLYESALKPVSVDCSIRLRSFARKRRHLPSTIIRAFSRQRGLKLAALATPVAGRSSSSGCCVCAFARHGAQGLANNPFVLSNTSPCTSLLSMICAVGVHLSKSAANCGPCLSLFVKLSTPPCTPCPVVC
jgi:hypothetical protein